jgi:hypothetical protein
MTILMRFGYILKHGISFAKQTPHVAAKECDLGHAAKNRQRGGENKYVSNLCVHRGQGSKYVIVFHESEGAPNHRVLKVRRPLHGRDLTGEVLPDAKVFRSPANPLPHSDQSGGDTGRGHRLLPPMNVSRQTHFLAARRV